MSVSRSHFFMKIIKLYLKFLVILNCSTHGQSQQAEEGSSNQAAAIDLIKYVAVKVLTTEDINPEDHPVFEKIENQGHKIFTSVDLPSIQYEVSPGTSRRYAPGVEVSTLRPETYVVFLSTHSSQVEDNLYTAHIAFIRELNATKSVEWDAYELSDLTSSYNNFYRALNPTKYYLREGSLDIENMDDPTAVTCMIQIYQPSSCKMIIEAQDAHVLADEQTDPGLHRSVRHIEKYELESDAMETTPDDSLEIDQPVTIPPPPFPPVPKSQSEDVDDVDIVMPRPPEPATESPTLAKEVPFPSADEEQEEESTMIKPTIKPGRRNEIAGNIKANGPSKGKNPEPGSASSSSESKEQGGHKKKLPVPQRPTKPPKYSISVDRTVKLLRYSCPLYSGAILKGKKCVCPEGAVAVNKRCIPKWVSHKKKKQTEEDEQLTGEDNKKELNAKVDQFEEKTSTLSPKEISNPVSPNIEKKKTKKAKHPSHKVRGTGKKSSSLSFTVDSFGPFYADVEKSHFDDNLIIKHMSEIDPSAMTKFVAHHTINQQAHRTSQKPKFESYKFPFTGAMNCNYLEPKSSSIIGAEKVKPVLKFYLHTLRAQCLSDLISHTHLLFDGELVSIHSSKSSISTIELNTKSPILDRSIYSASEWEDFLSALYLSKYSEAFAEVLNSSKNDKQESSSSISPSIQTLTLFVEKILELLSIKRFQVHAVKITRSLVETVTFYEDKRKKELFILYLFCSECYDDQSRSSSERKRRKYLESLKDYIIHGAPQSIHKPLSFQKFHDDGQKNKK